MSSSMGEERAEAHPGQMTHDRAGAGSATETGTVVTA